MVSTQSQPKDSKLEVVCEQLHALAVEKGPGAQLPPVRTLCQLLGTTRVTLAEALNVLEEQHVLYRMDRKGIYVSPKIHHKFIHILFDALTVTTSSTSPFWSMLWIYFAQEVQRRAESKEETYSFQLVMPTSLTANTVPEDVMQTLRSGRYDGLLAVGFNMYSEEWLMHQPLPNVVYAGAGKHRVEFDRKALILQGVRALARQGCKKIGLWLPFDPENCDEIEHLPDHHDFYRALMQLGLPFYPELVQRPHLAPQQKKSQFSKSQEYGYQIAMDVFHEPHTEKPDGVLITDDMLTNGSMVALQELGIRIGSELKIATHANKDSPVLFGHAKYLTLLEFNPMDIVQSMFATLDRLLAGEQLPESSISLSPSIKEPAPYSKK